MGIPLVKKNYSLINFTVDDLIDAYMIFFQVNLIKFNINHRE